MSSAESTPSHTPPTRQRKLLVANRSEIAIRVFRAATELGFRTVAIPFAWLAGLAAGEALGLVSQSLEKDRFRLKTFGTWKGLLVCGLIALALAWSMGRLESSVRGLQRRPRVGANAIIAKMEEKAASTHWAYADNPIYAFHARLPTPPELAVVTLKRFWSGQISTAEIVEACRRRPVELLLLGSVSRQDANWTNLLATGFVAACEQDNLTLYMAKRLKGKPFAELPR